MSAARDVIFAKLRALKPRLAERYGVEVIGIVGSWARDEARPGSDLDVAFDLRPGHPVTLFDLGWVAEELETATGLEIDLVDWRMVRPAFRPSMERDLRRIDDAARAAVSIPDHSVEADDQHAQCNRP
jgi:predicted nucleotidyltransferase